MSSDQANQAADAILALINSRPQSPSKEEIAVLIDRIANPHRPAPPDELRSGRAVIAKYYTECQWTPEEVHQMKLRQIELSGRNGR